MTPLDACATSSGNTGHPLALTLGPSKLLHVPVETPGCSVPRVLLRVSTDSNSQCYRVHGSNSMVPVTISLATCLRWRRPFLW